jgi:hypothetical protein
MAIMSGIEQRLFLSYASQDARAMRAVWGFGFRVLGSSNPQSAIRDPQ